jgi:hypothetical protein
MRQRRLSRVPAAAFTLFVLALALQLSLRATAPGPAAAARALPPAPPVALLRIAALGEPIGLGQLLVLNLQSFDTQPGVSVPFRDLDYERLEDWLARILALDPGSQYPLLLASQLYSQVPDEPRQRQMLSFVYREFLRDPAHRWRWLAHASLVARHRLHDLPLALDFARALATHASVPSVPSWARQMHIFLLEDMGEAEAAKVLLGGLLASGSVQDPAEIRFLTERLNALQAAENSSPLTKP